MYRCPAFNKVWKICLYTVKSPCKLVVKFIWYSWSVHMKEWGGGQVFHGSTFPADCTWHQKLNFILRVLLDITKRLILSPGTQNKHHFWIIDIYIKNTSKRHWLVLLKSSNVLRYIFSYRQNPVKRFWSILGVCSSGKSVESYLQENKQT